MKKILHIVGARPQFVKLATIVRAVKAHNGKSRFKLGTVILHTGQHYDDNMSDSFFKDLEIPKPGYNLGVGSDSHAAQTAKILVGTESVILKEHPDAVLLYGDTNSTIAGAIAASKVAYAAPRHRPIIAHVEAGLRSYDITMPEEANRIVVDHLSDLLFCPTKTSVGNLKKEGISEGVYEVGDVMYDSILHNAKLACGRYYITAKFGVEPKKYYIATVHRQSNTDDISRLRGILNALAGLKLPVLFPVHPRTRKAIGNLRIKFTGNIRFMPPVPYLDMLALEKNAMLILTDSGGVQKEAFILGVPCVTLRNETEWIETVKAGANIIAGTRPGRILSAISKMERRSIRRPAGTYGGGRSAAKIVKIISEVLS